MTSTESPAIPMRERILEVSTVLFAKSGYHGTSVRDIAREIDFSVSAVYNHFPSKEAILLEVLKRPIVELQEAVEAEVAKHQESPPAERFAACLRVHIYYLLEHRIDAELMTSEYMRLGPEMREPIVAMRNRYEEMFKQLVADCAPADQVDRRKVTVATNIVLGLAGNSHRWFRPDGPMTSGQLADFIVGIAVSGALADLSNN